MAVDRAPAQTGCEADDRPQLCYPKGEAKYVNELRKSTDLDTLVGKARLLGVPVPRPARSLTMAEYISYLN